MPKYGDYERECDRPDYKTPEERIRHAERFADMAKEKLKPGEHYGPDYGSEDSLLVKILNKLCGTE